MKPTAHLAASVLLSATLYFATKSIVVSTVSFFSGFLIDADHLLDYIREYGFRIDIKEFFRLFHETRFKKLLLIFHAWEWVLVLLILAALLKWNRFILGVTIGVFQHLVFDQMRNGVTPWGYFFIYRATKKFSVTDIVTDAALCKKRTSPSKES